MSAHALSRVVFTTSRLAEFCSKRELVNQTGHDFDDWPLVILKELVDNALDACEEASVAPVIEIDVSDTGITVSDNGPGIGPDMVRDILNYNTRTSSREAYASPTRGAQGNALKTILAMGFALDGDHGETVVESQGTVHRVTFSVDPVRQEPRIIRVCEDGFVKNGTRISVSWPNSSCSILDDAEARFLQTARDYTWANPHLTLTVKWDRSVSEAYCQTFQATDPAWRKWRPSDPTPPHWYDDARLGRLIANNIAHAEDHSLPCRTVADFVREFRGLSATAKARDICEEAGASRLSLSDFYADGNGDRVGDLLAAMKRQGRPVKPRDLGLIGEDHLRAKFENLGVAPETFSYKRVELEHAGVPYLIEAAFGYCPAGSETRRIVTGVNWSVSIGGDPFRQLGGYGAESLGSLLTNQRAGAHEPIVAVLHLACPRIEYLDRGKSSVNLAVVPGRAVAAAVEAVTAKWAKQRKAEERDASARLRRLDRLGSDRDLSMSIKEAAWCVMPEAYMAASAGGTLPANPRQIMYAARPEILAMTGKDTLDDRYFTQTLLPDYMREHMDTCAAWDIIWDDRGHFVEPHTEKRIGIGTLAVRRYLANYTKPDLEEAGVAAAKIKTSGPDCRYSAILYIEKEGFLPILEQARLAEKFDIAIMSCKGVSVTAARMLIDRTCARYGIPLLILHDFDISGFSIAKTLCSDTRRYTFKNEFETIDLGLRLVDVQELGSEPVTIPSNRDRTRETLRRNGATDDEISFLLRGWRVELNAMHSDQFVAFVERKLTEAGIAKVVPPQDQLAEAYRLFVRGKQIEEAAEKAIAELANEEITMPDDIEAKVRSYLSDHPDEPWDDAVEYIVAGGL